jgi:magnesium-transporting ATPase (P-type)
MLKNKYQTIATLDFSSQRKCMSMLIRGLIPGYNSLLLKGATERVIEKCATYKDRAGNQKPLSDQHKKDLIAQTNEFASKGLRCLAIGLDFKGGDLGQCSADEAKTKLGDMDKYNHFETGGCFLGIVCIKDPCRQEVKQAIVECKTAGIRVIMITGDAKQTAVAIAKELNILDEHNDDPNDSFTGAEFEALSE